MSLELMDCHRFSRVLVVKGFTIGLAMSLLAGCFSPPFNQFKPDQGTARHGAGGAGLGAAIGLVTSSTLSGALVGGAVGGAVGLASGAYKESKPGITKQLKKQDIEFIQYGNTAMLIVPTDKYFMFMSPRINELGYPGLNNIVRLLKLYPQTPIFVAAFTDNVGSKSNKNRLSQAQAETMLSFLWANGIQAKRLTAAGYGDKYDIADNHWMHGSAQNRRIEIQWMTVPLAMNPQSTYK